MLIANPIYDVIFKRLMENLDIAKGMLERILGTTIATLDFASQEFTTTKEEERLSYYRLDFTARIQTPDGYKLVMIEMQKGRIGADVERFRGYLAEEYKRKCEVHEEDGEVRQRGLPLITIYFFGFPIDERLPGAFKIDRRYVDLITGEALPWRCDAMERLTHDAYVVQISRLREQQRSEVEELLDIFRQDRIADPEGHMLNVETDSRQSDLVKDIIRTLGYLVADPVVQRKMAIEDEMYLAFEGGLEERTRELKLAKREAEREREEALRGQEEERRGREEALRGQEEERRGREEALRGQEEERRGREEERRRREEAEAEIARLQTVVRATARYFRRHRMKSAPCENCSACI